MNPRPELFPCPFCGQVPVLVRPDLTARKGSTARKSWVACVRKPCVIHPRTKAHDTIQEAADDWNTRAPSPDALREALAFIGHQPCEAYNDRTCRDTDACITEYCHPCRAAHALSVPEPATRKETCDCPTECDCQNFDAGLVSEECPIHNHKPRPSLTCPVHGEASNPPAGESENVIKMPKPPLPPPLDIEAAKRDPLIQETLAVISAPTPTEERLREALQVIHTWALQALSSDEVSHEIAPAFEQIADKAQEALAPAEQKEEM